GRVGWDPVGLGSAQRGDLKVGHAEVARLNAGDIAGGTVGAVKIAIGKEQHGVVRFEIGTVQAETTVKSAGIGADFDAVDIFRDLVSGAGQVDCDGEADPCVGGDVAVIGVTDPQTV